MLYDPRQQPGDLIHNPDRSPQDGVSIEALIAEWLGLPRRTEGFNP